MAAIVGNPRKKNLLGPYHIPLPDEPIDTERVVEQWDGTGHLLLAKDFTYS